jgi:hypothetical protein
LFSPFDDNDLAHTITETLTHTISFSHGLTHTLRSQLQGLKERTQSQHTLILSLITQDEATISRYIAEYSAMTAVGSRRDGSAMKTIAILTVLFLPATFVATLFGISGMFDWTPAGTANVDQMPTVSPFFWIYWAVAVPLTVVLMVVWRIWWRMEDRRHEREVADTKIDFTKPSKLDTQVELDEIVYASDKAQSIGQYFKQSAVNFASFLRNRKVTLGQKKGEA